MKKLPLVLAIATLASSCSDSEIDPSLEQDLRNRMDRIENLDSQVSELDPEISSLETEIQALELSLTKIEDEKREEWKRLSEERDDLAGWISLQGDVTTEEIRNALKKQSEEIERLRNLLKANGVDADSAQ